MQRFILIRILQAILTLLVLSVVVFFGSNLTGDAAFVLSASDATKDEIEAIRHNLGLDRPVHIRYVNYLMDIMTGDFGKSVTKRKPVGKMLAQRLPATIQLAAAGLFLAVAFGIPLGILSAVKRNTMFDRFRKSFATVGMAAPRSGWPSCLSCFLAPICKCYLPSGRGASTTTFYPASLSLYS